MKQKKYSEILSYDEINLLVDYISEKIKIFQRVKTDTFAEIRSLKETDDERRKELHWIISEYSSDISAYKRMRDRLLTNDLAPYNDILELWCMADNKEKYDKIHNDLHQSIVTKLKEYNEKQSGK